jgi:2-dehydropantoate 2-reductase
MKISVVGTGAMGSIYAALMGDSGNEVWALDRWAEHIEEIRKSGLRVEGKSGDRTVKINATTRADEAGICDLVIIATKAMHVEPAAESVRSLIGPDTIVLTIQNGLGSPDKVANILGGNRVIVGVVAGFGASMKGPGHAHHHGMELVRLGEMKGPITPRVEKVAQVWRHAGFTVKTFDDIDQLIWEKLICNVCYSGSCALTDWTLGEVIADPDAWRVASGCATEAYNVAKARGIKMDFDDPVAYVRDFGSKIPGSRPSMLLDHMEGRLSEIDAINGAIPPEGEKYGVPAPFNTAVSSLVRAKERRLGLR